MAITELEYNEMVQRVNEQMLLTFQDIGLISFLNDYQTYQYPQPIDTTLTDGITSFLNDYQTYQYPQPMDYATSQLLSSFMNDYQSNGYPSGSGGSVDLSSILTSLNNIIGYVDTVESVLSSIKAKTDTIGASVDLSSITAKIDLIKAKTDILVNTDLTAINSKLDSVKAKTDILNNANLSTLENELSDITSIITDKMDAKISSVNSTVSALLSDPSALSGLDYFDLDGNYCSFPNGSTVYMYPNNKQFTVEKSYLFQNDTHNFVIMYVLIDSAGKRMVLPQTFLSSQEIVTEG